MRPLFAALLKQKLRFALERKRNSDEQRPLEFVLNTPTSPLIVNKLVNKIKGEKPKDLGHNIVFYVFSNYLD